MIPDPDSRVVTVLNELGLPYEKTEEGDFRVTVPHLAEPRGHVVVIRSATNIIAKTEWRTAGAIAYRFPGDSIPETHANTLLDHTGTVPIGGWAKLRAGGECLAVFTVQLPADADAELMLEVLEGMAATVDKMERYLQNEEPGG